MDSQKDGYKLRFENRRVVYEDDRGSLTFGSDAGKPNEETGKNVIWVERNREKEDEIKKIKDEELRMIESKRYGLAFERVKEHWVSVGCKVKIWPDDDKEVPKWPDFQKH